LGLFELNFDFFGVIAFFLHFAIPTFLILCPTIGWEELCFKFEQFRRRFESKEQTDRRHKKEWEKTWKETTTADRDGNGAVKTKKPSSKFRTFLLVAMGLSVYFGWLGIWNYVLIFHIYEQ
jgi:hypothetical protein